MHVRVAEPADVAAVARVLSAAAVKLVTRGEALWTLAEVSETAVEPHIRSSLYHVGFDGEEVVGAFRLQLQDPVFWPEIPEGTSAYLHKLAVLPGKQGRGFAHQLLGHAVRLTREKGLLFLRLDCVANRPKLRSVYESFGFRHHSQKQIGGGMFDRFEFDVGAPDV
ncbi:MAG: acetyltransferase family protein [Ramlibacter sp.]|nr:acetyltransferase family protein [Ramlibacter sp.]